MATRLRKVKRVLKGKVYGNSLITGPSTSYELRGDNLWNGKEGYFEVENGYVLRYVYCKDIFKS